MDKHIKVIYEWFLYSPGLEIKGCDKVLIADVKNGTRYRFNTTSYWSPEIEFLARYVGNRCICII